MSRSSIRLGTLGLVFAVAFSTVASAAIITNVVRANDQEGNRDAVGPFTGDMAPLPIEKDGLMNGNLVFSDRTYPWSMTPQQLVGSEYVRTYNTDQNGGEVGVHQLPTPHHGHSWPRRRFCQQHADRRDRAGRYARGVNGNR
ncbi:MAG: hypothetical protein JSW27_09450 [Phycisphaerales bacterium]|nr:MAG: hypothetical protein JSW27_09450 [Phycisphaerales bacterium]